MIINENYTLTNGIKIPKIGLGTWMIDMEKSAQVAVDAVKAGYRLFDLGYENSPEIMKGIKASGLKREEYFISTKISAFDKSYEACSKGIAEHLRSLDLQYIDMLVIHSPQPWTDFKSGTNYDKENLEVWRALEDAYDAGIVKAIGVSNFEIHDLQNILDHCRIRPMVNQILAHVSNTPFELVEFCQKNGILVEAYSPIGHGELLKNEELKAIADKYAVSTSQLCIRYCLQMGMLPLPKTQQMKYLVSNKEVDFDISDDDMRTLKNMEKIENYGDSSIFPVYGGKMKSDGSYNPGEPL